MMLNSFITLSKDVPFGKADAAVIAVIAVIMIIAITVVRRFFK